MSTNLADVLLVTVTRALARQGRSAEGVPYAKQAVAIFTSLRYPAELAAAQAALKECQPGS